MQTNFLHSSDSSIATLVSDFFDGLTPSNFNISEKRIQCVDNVIKSSFASGVASVTQFDKIITSAYNSGVSKLTKKKLILELNKMVDDFYNH